MAGTMAGESAGAAPDAALAARVAAEIKHYARSSDLPEGAHLTEQKLADLLHVSRSPVREALLLLESEGIVVRRPNRGSFLARAGRDLPETRPAVRIDDDADYVRIAEDRLNGTLPERASEAALGRRYGLPRARLLTLLGRMRQEGWAERLPGHGWHFPPMVATASAYEDGYRYRAAIEPAALLSPGFVADPAVLRRLRREQEGLLARGFRRIARTELFHINAGFHEALAELSGNSFFIDGLRRVNRLRRLFEFRKALRAEELTRQCREHLQILDLIEAGDRAGAAALMDRHLRMRRELVLPDRSRVAINP